MSHGIPRSFFLGAGDGSWSAEDRGYALAWQQYEQSRCSGCGHDLAVSTHKDNQFEYEAEVVRCHACAAKHRVTQKFQKEGGDTAGLLTRMTKYPRA